MNLNHACKIHLICSVLIVVIAAMLGGVQQAVSAAAGAMIIMVSVGFMVWAIQRMFEKKSVALAGMVIVIKYLLLAVALYWLTQQQWAHIAWVAAGVGSVVLTAVFYSLTTNDENETENKKDGTDN
jgi:NhaP-type Na+/H+ and K+/H+ antiporter